MSEMAMLHGPAGYFRQAQMNACLCPCITSPCNLAVLLWECVPELHVCAVCACVQAGAGGGAGRDVHAVRGPRPPQDGLLCFTRHALRPAARQGSPSKPSTGCNTDDLPQG